MTDESLKIATEILIDILQIMKNLELRVPIGLNVEHIMSYNFQYSINMLQELSKYTANFVLKLHYMINKKSIFANLLKERILVLDGAMGTMIQECELNESDFRGELFSKHN